MSHRFEPIRVKIERAKEHFNLLKGVVEEFRRLNTHKTVFNYDAEQTKFFADVVVPEHPSEYWAVVIGDVLHNLRSAFDHAIAQLEIANGRVPDLETEFGVFDDPTKLDKSIKGGIEHRIPSGAVAVFKGLQPCVRGTHFAGHPLFMLHHMNIWDKHKLLNLMFTVMPHPKLWSTRQGADGFPVRNQIFTPGTFIPVKPGTMRYSLAWTVADRPMQVDGEFTFDVQFDKAGPGKGKSVLPLLQQFIDFTGRALYLFYPFLS